MNKIAVFTIAGEEFGIELIKIVEIIKPRKVTPVPKVPAFISGMINLRGKVIPVMDLRVRFSVKPSSSRDKILIAKMHGEEIGLIVDSVKEIINIEKEQIASPPTIFRGLKPEYLKGIGKLGDRLIIILNLDSLLTAEEMVLLEERKENLNSEVLPENISQKLR